ncbi:MAG TPA: cupredoxin domain-containing protein [Terriglobales bacterium]|nr:cupredoxin domain-containing protein [Terriglobales bacterium]
MKKPDFSYFWKLVLTFLILTISCAKPIPIYDVPPPVPDTVNIYDDFFDPPTFTVRVGTSVTFTNLGYHDHSVTSDKGVFDSGTLAPGQSFSFTFQDMGEFSFHCKFHPEMLAKIIVQ